MSDDAASKLAAAWEVVQSIECCGSCHFFETRRSPCGECRRFPPVIEPTLSTVPYEERGGNMSFFPTVSMDEYCGEYKKNENSDDEPAERREDVCSVYHRLLDDERRT